MPHMKNNRMPQAAVNELDAILRLNPFTPGDELEKVLIKHNVKGDPGKLQARDRKARIQRFSAATGIRMAVGMFSPIWTRSPSAPITLPSKTVWIYPYWMRSGTGSTAISRGCALVRRRSRTGGICCFC